MTKSEFFENLPDRYKEVILEPEQISHLTKSELADLSDRVLRASQSGQLSRRDFLWFSVFVGIGATFFGQTSNASPFFNMGAFWRKRSSLSSSAISVEDYFATHLYLGNGTQQEVRNGIKLADSAVTDCFAANIWTGLYASARQRIINGFNLTSGSGNSALIWMKSRGSGNHILFDNIRGQNSLRTTSTNAESADTSNLASFNSDGFSSSQSSGENWVSWTFVQQDNFFKIVTFSHTNGSNTNVDLSTLGTVGMFTVKRRDGTGGWAVWHRYIGNGNLLYLDTTQVQNASSGLSLSGTTATVSSGYATGAYVMYAWAHDVSGTGTIQCGGYAGNSSTNAQTIGWRPQFLMVKRTDVAASSWMIMDAIRGSLSGSDTSLSSDNTNAEGATASISGAISTSSTGFSLLNANSALNVSGSNYVYLAIRAADFVSSDTSGGMIWIKQRTGVASSNVLADTKRGVGATIYSDSDAAQFAGGSPIQTITGFSGSGFTVGSNVNFNRSADDFVSWAFRIKPNFYYQTTYTGNGVNNRVISLPSGWTKAPGMVVVKRTDSTGDWWAYHRSATGELYLNLTSSQSSNFTRITAVSTSGITLSNAGGVNDSGATYVMYVFCHDDSSTGIIQCGTYTTDGSSNATVNLGWEPQWIMMKRPDASGGWYLIDNMRSGIVMGTDTYMYANQSGGESGNTASVVEPTPTGFKVSGGIHAANYKFIYVAIRRGPMKVPTVGADVFAINTHSGNETTKDLSSGFPVDMTLSMARTGSSINHVIHDRLRGRLASLSVPSSNAESTNSTGYGIGFDQSAGVKLYLSTNNVNSHTYVNYKFRRAPQFFDIVCYTGTGSAGLAINHNLTIEPSMIWVKCRSASASWAVYHKGLTSANQSVLILNATDSVNLNNSGVAAWNAVSPTSTTFTVGSSGTQLVNVASSNYVAYLFGDCPGVSKAAAYTGTGVSSLTVNTGFQPRFLIVKRADAAADWFVYDSTRGTTVVGYLNNTNAEAASSVISFTSTGFTVNTTSASFNASGGTYVYYAVA